MVSFEHEYVKPWDVYLESTLPPNNAVLEFTRDREFLQLQALSLQVLCCAVMCCDVM